MRVMISGHFYPFHDAHLDYLKQAVELGGFLVCVVSSDKQVLMKKGKLGIPEEARREILDLILTGLHVEHQVVINYYDDDGLVAEALRQIKPDIFFRAGDKTLETMPFAEWVVCKEIGIEIKHGQFRIDRHGSSL